jgi:CRP-like cAMP-binding protein
VTVTPPEELLERHPLLARLRPEQVAKFAAAGELEAFKKGEQIVTDGSIGDAMYLVLSGSVTVEKGDRVLATLLTGEFFGEMCLVEPATRSANVLAAEPSFLFRLPTFSLQRLLQEEPDAFNLVLVTLVKVLSERLRRTNTMLSSVGQLADWLAGSLV